jgi:hypothetical protein
MLWSHVRKDLSAYCEGQLPADSARRVAEHLKRCDQCRRECEEVRLGIAFARQLRPANAPEALWAEIESKLNAEDSTRSDGHPAARAALAFWKPAVVVAAALLVALAVLMARRPSPIAPRTVAPPVFLDLGDYLRPLQAASSDASRQAVLSAPPRFAPQELPAVLRAAGLREAQISALPEFRLAAHRAAKLEGMEIVQLVYTRDDEAFSVFVAPDRVTFGFGRESAVEALVGGIRCLKVDCPKQETYAFTEAGFRCVLVSKSLDAERAVAIIKHFMTAQRPEGSRGRHGRGGNS